MQFMFDRLCTHLDREAPGRYLVHNTTANDDVFRFSFTHKTYDGIRAGGDRLVAECESVLFQFPSISSISLVGHSLGGMYARYIVGRLLERGWLAQPDVAASAASTAPASSSQGELRPRRLHASHFVTLATPHLGAQQIGKIVPLSAARWFVRKFLGAAAAVSLHVCAFIIYVSSILSWFLNDCRRYRE
jgi:triacylglycerol esterase/lipase EstA (alpha/beta hydrolase family)